MRRPSRPAGTATTSWTTASSITAAAPHGSAQAFSVADQKGETGKPDLRVTLTAQQAKVRLASGAEVDAWSFDGRVPGPELRVRQGDLVEVTLANDDIEDGVTIHWHGVDVPNAEDGVAGVTQDAVLPGQTTHLPLPPGAGRNLLVPHARGRLERREARVVRDARDPAPEAPAGRRSISRFRCTRSRAGRRSGP